MGVQITAGVAPDSGAPPAGGVAEFFRYHGFWAPGVRLFRGIGFQAKAWIITLTFMLPIAFLAWQYYRDKGDAIDFSSGESVGVAYLRDALPALQALQDWRAAAVQDALDGKPRPETAAVRAQVEGAMKQLAAAQARHGARIDTAAAHDAVQKAVRDLPAGEASAAKLLDAHGKGIDAMLALVTAVADASALTLDPEIDSYYLMDGVTVALPLLVEASAKLRLQAMAIAGGTQATVEIERAAHANETIGDMMGERLAGGVAKVASLHPGFGERVGSANLHSLLQKFHDIAAGGVGPALIAESGDKALAALRSAQAGMLDTLDSLLAERTAALQRSRNLTTGVLLLSLAAAAYLFVSFRKVLDGGLREVAFHIDAMRDGDLTTRPRAWGADEAAQLMHTLQQMQDSLRRIVTQVRTASDHIVHSSSEIAAGAHDLSARTEQSAANLQRSASAMDEVAATVRQTAAGAGDASRLAGENAEVAARGGRVIGTMVATMEGIHAASSRIGDIIGTIDGIAFQTNILALNAAVEAARAGTAGRGFAVVATEVRALAQRSAAAAREIKGLITSSVEQVAAGSAVVAEAGATIGEIVDTSTRVNAVLREISTGAEQQALGVTETTQSVQALDSATQQNAALVEQTAAAAASLQERAHALAAEVAQFRLPPG